MCTAMTEFSRLLDELHLDGDDDETLPPITALLSKLQQRLIGGPPDPSLLVDTVAGFFRTAEPHRLFDSADGEAALEAAYVSAVCALIGRAALPAYERARDGPPTPDRYARVPDVAARVCGALRGLLGKVEAAGPDRRARGVLMAVAPHVCAYAVTHTQEQPWTSRASREAARRLRASLLGAGSWRDCAHMLTGERAGANGAKAGAGGILEAVLDVLRPRLTKEAWQRGDEVESAFAWTLFQVKRPSLAPHLPRLLGPALLISDHHEPKKCMLGVRCLHHIVVNTASSELRALKRADVMYEALVKLLYGTKNADVIQLVLRCLLDLLPVLESPPSSVPVGPSPAPGRARRRDDVLRLMLTHMEAEHEVALRRVYARALPAYLERLARSVSVWLPCLLRLLADAPSELGPRRDVARRLSRGAARCAALLAAAAGGRLQVSARVARRMRVKLHVRQRARLCVCVEL
ncbi:TELO2-interacting protein 2 isoform X4 [Phycodurus eques]|uniref:TELO2-interacting protein 2 isoform X4 n=1 Tax=Phycodurus eques TaxID=693459 RepID=UPI002ACE0062|nr:TELO2-interacting protein 2 isoform X4 [Phycodurus eques]